MSKEKMLPEMSWPEVEEVLKETDIVMLPVGATEQHGPHLPLGVDTYVPLDIAKKVSRKTGIPVAPPIWFNTCEWHMCFPGTISINPRTMISLIRDVCESLHRHGFNHFILLNGHTSGANPVLLSAADEVQKQLDIKLWVIDVVLVARDEIIDVCEAELLFHADEIEASQMLVARRDLVNLDRAEKVIPDFFSEYVRSDYSISTDEILNRLTPEEWRQLTPYGQIGDPTLATEEKGEVMINSAVNNLTEFVGDLADREK